MKCIAAIDFGSTFTKVSAINIKEGKIIATSKAFTTIETDICDGLNTALYELRGNIGGALPVFSEMYASSSAGGGLKMVSCGLVPELTAKAARIAASSAGAKVMKTFSYELSRDECDDIFHIKPDIILLSGGTDGGNKQVIIENAKKIAEIDGAFHVIVAGNKSAAADVDYILKKAGKHSVICGNVMPSFNILEITSAKNEIRKLFIEKIIYAKGLDKAQEMMSGKIIPTPLAVFDAMELLSRGYGRYEGAGDLLAVDIGGATTDVYSMCEGKPSQANVLEKGLREPFAKRSVEGDLGLRYGMQSLVEEAGIENAALKSEVSTEEIKEWMEACALNPGIVPMPEKDKNAKKIDDALAGLAAEIAIRRHAGVIESVYTPFGETFIQTGKDLTRLSKLIGIGGPLINAEDPRKVLTDALNSKDTALGFYLTPRAPEILLDKKYIAAGMGLAAKKYPEKAIKIMREEILEV